MLNRNTYHVTFIFHLTENSLTYEILPLSLIQRSALAYHNDSSIDGALNRFNVGVSTTSSASQSTSKSSGALYRPEGYLHTTSSTSTSGNIPSAMDLPPNAGIPPYGWDVKAGYSKKKKRDGG